MPPKSRLAFDSTAGTENLCERRVVSRGSCTRSGASATCFGIDDVTAQAGVTDRRHGCGRHRSASRLNYFVPKAEISWKRVTEDGTSLQVYAQHVSREWLFFAREKRFDRWQAIAEPPLEDWIELLDAVKRRINRRRLRPEIRQ